jgi:hypothetical protein
MGELYAEHLERSADVALLEDGMGGQDEEQGEKDGDDNRPADMFVNFSIII